METDPKIIKALELWAKEQPDSNEPLIISSSRNFSPNQMVEEVKSCSKMGQSIYECFKEFYLQGKGDSMTSSGL